jgi:hypothetical protein
MHGLYLISLVSWGENSRKKISIGFENISTARHDFMANIVDKHVC